MPEYIDNIVILKAIDTSQQQRGGRPYPKSAWDLLAEISGAHAADPQMMPGFLQELFVARAAGHLTWRLTNQTVPPQDSNYYLQQMFDLALTPDGQDRARGRMIERPLPSPDEDDGHELSDLILQQVADIVSSEYAADQRVTFLAEEGIPPDWLEPDEGAALDDVHAVLAATWRAASPGRELVRRFLGRWLDERLLTGPNAEQRATLTGQLLRQGWRIRDSDSVLVATEPVRGVPVPAPPLHYWQPHPLVENVVRPQFLHRQLDQAVFAAMKTVEVRVRQLAGFGDNVFGADLMNRTFGTGAPLAPPQPPGTRHDDGPRCLFCGAMSMFRNPVTHLEVGYTDAEAVEAVALASVLMRHLDQVEDRLLAAARPAQAPTTE